MLYRNYMRSSDNTMDLDVTKLNIECGSKYRICTLLERCRRIGVFTCESRSISQTGRMKLFELAMVNHNNWGLLRHQLANQIVTAFGIDPKDGSVFFTEFLPVKLYPYDLMKLAPHEIEVANDYTEEDHAYYLRKAVDAVIKKFGSSIPILQKAIKQEEIENTKEEKNRK